MCYETAIATTGGDEATLTKSLIASLVDAAANWYSKLPPGCLYSWQQLKEKFLLNFQGFQAELDTEGDFLSCAQREKETPPISIGGSYSCRLRRRNYQMIKSLLRTSKPSGWGVCTAILSGSGPKQCQSSTNSLQNSASMRSNISTSINNRGKF
jgi:hypothetical protein